MLERELKRGSAELLILALVEERPRHGYEIGQLIDSRSGGAIRFHVASLYPTLYRLEDRGLLELFAGLLLDLVKQGQHAQFRRFFSSA